MPKSSKIILIIFAGVLLLSTLLRLYQLNSGLWLDEFTTYFEYARKPFLEIVTSFESENQHFVYSILAHASFLIFGESNWALRIPAVLFGVCSIAALFLFGRLVTRPLEALLATALMAFSYHHVWFSQNARGYTGMLFWTLISSSLLLMAIRRRKYGLWILYAITAALGAYTHLTMLFVVAGQFVVVVVDFLSRPKFRIRKFFIELLFGFGLAGLFTLLFHAPVLDQMRTVIGGSQVSVVSEWKSPLWTIREILAGLQIGFSGVAVAAIAFGMLSLGIYSYWRSYPEVVGLFLLPSLIGAVITIAIGHHLWPRFFFFAMGFGALILVRGIMVVGNWFAKMIHISTAKSWLVGATLSVLLIVLSAFSVPSAFGPKQDFDAVLSYISAQFQPGDRVLTVSIAADVYKNFYRTDWKPVESLGQLSQARSQAHRTWIIYTFPEVLEAVYPDIMKTVENDFHLVAQFPGTVNSGDIYILRADP